jgi:hypothetical protein
MAPAELPHIVTVAPFGVRADEHSLVARLSKRYVTVRSAIPDARNNAP